MKPKVIIYELWMNYPEENPEILYSQAGLLSHMLKTRAYYNGNSLNLRIIGIACKLTENPSLRIKKTSTGLSVELGSHRKVVSQITRCLNPEE